MCLQDLRIGAARYALRQVSSEELKQFADDTLNHGLYSYSLGELATLFAPIMSEAAPLFESALQELDVPLPSKEDAVTLLLEHIIRSIVEGTLSPYEGLCRLVHECYYPVISQEKVFKYVGDSRGIHHLIGAYWSYDDLRERPSQVSFAGNYGPEAINGLDREVVEFAAKWNRTYSRARLDPRWLTSTVVDLAKAIRDERALDRMPILADALMDAGCDNEEIIAHCRSQAPHARGCWVVDILLGAE
jgi:hypothetical protein